MPKEILLSKALSKGSGSAHDRTVVWPKCESNVRLDPKVEQRVDALIHQMTLAQKVGQMMQPEIRHITPAEVAQYHIGSILNGGGSFPGEDKYASVDDWVALADAYHTASMQPASDRTPIPILWGVDAVHGHNNVYGATIFPHNVGLGATNNPELVKEIAVATAREVAATGIEWSFAPTVAVVRDDRWGRGYESYGEDPEAVARYARVMVEGLQGEITQTGLASDRVIATAKHFIGDGGTEHGIDQGDNTLDEQTLLNLHAPGYFAALRAGAQSVMVTFNSWCGDKVHGHRYLLTDVLKGQMGFDGIVVSDWNGFKQVEVVASDSCKNSINAGIDMIMVPEDWRPVIETTIRQVQQGEISIDRIDDAVRRILRVKLRAGLFERPPPSQRITAEQRKIVGDPLHRATARQAVRESLVLLKNNEKLLPLSPVRTVLVAGHGAHNIGQQCGGWSLTWQGTGNENQDFPNGESIWTGIQRTVEQAGGQVELSPSGEFTRKPDVAIVVFGEQPYAEGEGDRSHLSYSADYPEDLQLLKRLKEQDIPVIGVFLTGRPMWVNPELNATDAFVVAWLPGTEGEGVADVLFRNAAGAIEYDFVGRLPVSWPNDAMHANCNIGDSKQVPLFPCGYGLSAKDSKILSALEPLNEDDSSGKPDLHAGLRVFDRRPIAPYHLYLGDEIGMAQTVAGARAQNAAKTLAVETVDFQLQEDARKLSWSGEGYIYLKSLYGQDLAAQAVQGAALEFVVRVHDLSTDSISLGLSLDYPQQCLNIAQDLLDLPSQTWSVLSYDLSRFAAAGVDIHHVDVPFLLRCSGQAVISIANIQIVMPDSARRLNLPGGLT